MGISVMDRDEAWIGKPYFNENRRLTVSEIMPDWPDFSSDAPQGHRKEPYAAGISP